DEGMGRYASDQPRMVQHVLHSDRKRVLLALDDDTQGISHQQHIDPGLLDNAREERVVRRDHDDLPAFGLALSELRDRHANSAFCRISGSRSTALIAMICTPSQCSRTALIMRTAICTPTSSAFSSPAARSSSMIS